MPKHRKKWRHQKKCCMLGEVRTGQRVKICCHHSQGAVRQRLLDLGFVPQAEVEIIRRAPFGDPIECYVANYKVALRNSEADLIQIDECD